ncbi:MAG: Mrp/NBP35 family ATP-binding protein, partial [Oscillospiraceae bacterium]|nr:Mrp/NBP35 family ATP-binding protein [Oscillospiraceae bacterium]
MNECTHDCSTCSSCCSERTAPQSLLEKPNEMSKIGKVIGIVSGKGGVGKSLVSSMLAVGMQRAGKHAAILDADITGPSIPKAFGIKGRVLGNELGMIPARSKMGIDIMSVNL